MIPFRAFFLKTFLSFLFLFILGGNVSFSQPKLHIPGVAIPPVFIRNLTVTGNEKTDDFVILREVLFAKGDTFKLPILTYSRSRIYSLGLFNKVEIIPEPVGGDSIDLNINVIERWYIFPFPLLGTIDGDLHKIYYGAGIYHTNFRGRNEKLVGSFAFGYDPFISLYYYNPVINERPELFLETKLSAQIVHNRSIYTQLHTGDYEELHYDAGINLGSRIGFFRRITTGITFTSVKVTQYQPNRTIALNGKDNYLTLRLSYNYDTRDISSYATYGMLLNASIAKVGLTADGVNFSRGSFDYRRYIRIKLDSLYSMVSAFRLFSVTSQGKHLPNYEHVFFGYGERIRGYNTIKYEGENLAVAAMEFRFPLLLPKTYRFDFIPITQFSVMRFGIYFALFGNVGAIQYQPMHLADYVFKKGYGAGLHFILPYDYVFRTEVAFNELRQAEFIAELGTSF